MDTKKLAVRAVLVALALILAYIETMIPSPGIPGVKLGLANMVTVFAVYRLGVKDAAVISALRVVLASAMFGSVSALMFSAAGAALSIAVMALVKRAGMFTPVGVSVAGAVAHNAGQLLVAMAVVETKELAFYMPALAASGVVSGILIGLAGGVLINRLKNVS